MAPNRPICQVDAITSRSEWLGVLIMVNRASTGHKRVISDLYAPGLTLLEGDDDGAYGHRLWLKPSGVEKDDRREQIAKVARPQKPQPSRSKVQRPTLCAALEKA